MTVYTWVSTRPVSLPTKSATVFVIGPLSEDESKEAVNFKIWLVPNEYSIFSRHLKILLY